MGVVDTIKTRKCWQKGRQKCSHGMARWTSRPACGALGPWPSRRERCPVLGHNIPPYPVSRLAQSVQSITQLETEVRFWPWVSNLTLNKWIRPTAYSAWLFRCYISYCVVKSSSLLVSFLFGHNICSCSNGCIFIPDCSTFSTTSCYNLVAYF